MDHTLVRYLDLPVCVSSLQVRWTIGQFPRVCPRLGCSSLYILAIFFVNLTFSSKAGPESDNQESSA